jgi:uncharacterized membrane protein
MNPPAQLVLTALLMVLVDIPWLSLIGGHYTDIVRVIQGGREVRMRPLAGVVVYPAMAFLALKTTSLKDAFLTGLATYAVYDFTVMAVFKDYPLYMAVADALWGAFLFMAVFWIRQKYF